jgi:phosphatidate phosphatase APP1
MLALLHQGFCFVALFLPFRRPRTTVSRDDVVVFYPSYAARQPDGNWNAVIQGCVFHSRVPWLRGKPVMGLIRRFMRVDRAGDEFFRSRMRQFLVNTAASRTVSIAVGAENYTVGPTDAAGLFRSEVLISDGHTDRIREESTPNIPWVQFRANLSVGDDREFLGQIQLLEPQGVSIISDVDDTLKISNVPNRRDLFHNTFARAFTPIPGMPALYQACAAAGAAFHYVSGSPWQLFEPLSQFWREHVYPWGSFHLKRFRLRETARKMRTTSPQKVHKRAAIEPLVAAFPHRRFILIGDAGEQDPDIYASLMRDYPEQVAHIYIRSVRGRLVDVNRMHAACAGLPSDRWTLYENTEEIAASVLQHVGTLQPK